MKNRDRQIIFPEALDFTFIMIDGKNIHLSDFKGKVIVIDSFALWCSPCRIQLSILKESMTYIEKP